MEDLPALARDLQTAAAMIVGRLPVSTRWPAFGTYVDWSFWGNSLRIDVEALGVDEEMRTVLQPFLVFGECAFDGGARPVLGMHKMDGTVHGIDLERDADPVFWFNSSLESFIETFRLLDAVLRNSEAVTPDLRAAVERLDPTVFPKSDWAGLLGALAKDL